MQMKLCFWFESTMKALVAKIKGGYCKMILNGWVTVWREWQRVGGGSVKDSKSYLYVKVNKNNLLNILKVTSITNKKTIVIPEQYLYCLYHHFFQDRSGFQISLRSWLGANSNYFICRVSVVISLLHIPFIWFHKLMIHLDVKGSVNYAVEQK